MKFPFLAATFALCHALSLAQMDSLGHSTTDSFVVDTILISGNERTKDYVILDEMTIMPGTLATPQLIEFDRSRIYSLALFTHVDMSPDTLGGRRALVVDVGERWYLIPIVEFGFRDGDPKRPYFGGGLVDYNFRGRNQRLSGVAVFGDNPAAGFGFRDPLIDRSRQLSFSGNISYSRIRNKSQIESAITGDFDEDHYDINTALGRRFSLFETATLNLGFEEVQIANYRPGRTASSTGKDAYLYATASYAYDTRDLREYPADGALLNFFVTKNGFGEATLSYTRLGADLRKYIPLPLDFSVAGRAFGNFALGTFIPPYGRVYFGYNEIIRGYDREVFEGEDVVGATVELHWPLLAARTIRFTAIPLPPEFSVWRFGVGLALFADAGTTWFRNQPVTFNSFSSGYGAGIHFLLPYSAIMRVEYAWNEYGRGQFILDFRSSI